MIHTCVQALDDICGYIASTVYPLVRACVWIYWLPQPPFGVDLEERVSFKFGALHGFMSSLNIWHRRSTAGMCLRVNILATLTPYGVDLGERVPVKFGRFMSLLSAVAAGITP